ncbi:MAG TPA: hypothetical protein VK907_06715 [Phnomibacter sp.]|nr:hypothetical protein [Phnomibacter sp.]
MKKQLFSKNVFRLFSAIAVFALFIFSSACQKTADSDGADLKPSDFEAAMRAKGNKTVRFPAEDPGAPLYARVTPLLNQILRVNGYVVVPFYRDPACIRPDLNLFELFDVPAAFGCALTCHGQFVIESDAPMGTFPIIVQTRSNSLPMWMVPEAAFDAAAADGVMTIAELNAPGTLKATATTFEEMLKPRMEKHHVVINAEGTLDADGRPFSFQVNLPGNTIRSISLKM